MNAAAALKSQYHAALAALKQPTERCPDELWTAKGHPSQFWQVAYHALFFTHLYLEPDEASFRPWEHHRQEYQFLESVPWPPHNPPKLEAPYGKSEILEYWRICDGMIDAGVDKLDLDAADCGFWWYKMPKLDHQIMNIRHTQEHAAQLEERIRAATGVGPDWFGGNTGKVEFPRDVK